VPHPLPPIRFLESLTYRVLEVNFNPQKLAGREKLEDTEKWGLYNMARKYIGLFVYLRRHLDYGDDRY
jgi:hypothetical protein